MVSYEGLLDGLTAMGVVASSITFGLLFLYKSKKLKANLLTYAGFMVFFAGLLYLGPLSDFLSVLLIGKNLENTQGIYGILSYMWVAPALIFAMYLGAELMIPEKKWYIVLAYVILAIIFELFLFLDTMNSFKFQLINTGEDLIDSGFVYGSPTFLLIAIFLLSTLFFNGFGFLFKSFKLTGVLKTKFIYLSLAFIAFVMAGAGDSLVTPGVLLVFVRVLMVSSSWLMYMGFKK